MINKNQYLCRIKIVICINFVSCLFKTREAGTDHFVF